MSTSAWCAPFRAFQFGGAASLIEPASALFRSIANWHHQSAVLTRMAPTRNRGHKLDQRAVAQTTEVRSDDQVERPESRDQRKCRVCDALHRAVQTANVVVLIGEGRRGLGDEVGSPERIQAGSDPVAESLQQCTECILNPLRRVEVEGRQLHLTHNRTAGRRGTLNGSSRQQDPCCHNCDRRIRATRSAEDNGRVDVHH